MTAIPQYWHLRKQKNSGLTTIFMPSPLLRQYFDRNLLSRAMPTLIHDLFSPIRRRAKKYHSAKDYYEAA